MSKQEILERVRAALQNGSTTAVGDLGVQPPASESVPGSISIAASESALGSPVPNEAPPNEAPAEDQAPAWVYGQPTAVEDKVALFIERVIDYKATVERVANPAGVAVLVARFLSEVGAKSCVIPPHTPERWTSLADLTGVKIIVDKPGLSKMQLDQVSAVLTGAAYAVAETGTIALDHRANQGRRIISLLPDTHICIVYASQIVSDVPEAMARLEPAILAGQPITWVSGPSATSDIELVRVEGVHGPRNLYVIVVDDSAVSEMLR